MSLAFSLGRAAGAALLCAAIAPAAHSADNNISYASAGLGFTTAPSSASEPPSGFRTWASSSSVTANYVQQASCTTATSPCLKITVTNPTSSPQSYGMLGNTTWTPAAGEQYRLKANIAVQNPGGRSTIIGVGYESFGAPGSDLTDGPTSVVEQSLTTHQTAEAYLTANTTSDRFGQVLPSMQPRIKIYNIPAGATVSILVGSFTLDKALLGDTWIKPLKSVQSMLPSRPFQLSVGLLSQASIAGYKANLRLVLTGTTTTVDYGSRTVTAGLSSTSGIGALQDSWSGSNAPTGPGTYDVYYRLIPANDSKGAKLYRTDTNGVAEAPDNAGGYQYKIGQVTVDWAATMDIGNTFHDLHPATSAPVQHRFARSLGHTKTKLENWWRVVPGSTDPVMAWDEGNQNFPEWVIGVSGFIRKAIVTFYGMRTAIAYDTTPASTGAWGPAAVNLGYVSAPTASGMDIYAKVVRKTVTKFKNSLYAVECWNEPDSTGHYLGSQTQLADICKRVYLETKAVDTTNKIKVICPQASSPASIGYVLGARTSQNEPITNFCEMIGTHLYGYTGADTGGKAYSLNSLASAIEEIKYRAAKFPGTANKALAATEFGPHNCLWNGGYTQLYPVNQLDDAKRGDIVYQSLLALKEQGVRSVALYSYDNNREETVNGCAIYGGYSWQFLANPQGAGSAITPVTNRIDSAVTTF